MNAATATPLAIEEDVPLAPFTSFGIGGPARYFVRVTTGAELGTALLWAKERHLSWYLLGAGTNILVSDEGFLGLVIRMEIDGLHREGDDLVAGAGAPLAAAVDRAAAWGLTGLEFFAGIPGTVGGAVRGNAGAFGAAMGDVVTVVSAFDTLRMQIVSLPAGECAFSYRDTLFKQDPRLVIVSARFALAAGDGEEIRRQMDHIVSRRGDTLQHEMSVGSYFVNPIPTDPEIIRRFEEDRRVVCRNCMVPAGWFIDKAGLRGTRVGGAMVSERHGNYLINTGSATAADIRSLATLVRSRVRETLGVELEEEVNYLGFEKKER